MTLDESPVRESCTPGSVGEVPGNRHLYPTTTLAPESCGAICEGGGEALTGERIGQPLSREKSYDPGADALDNAEGNMCGAVMRGTVALAGSEATSRMDGSRRNLGDLVWPAVA